MQRSQVLQNMGTEAVDAKKAYEQAVLSEDIALSLYNDATHNIHFNA